MNDEQLRSLDRLGTEQVNPRTVDLQRLDSLGVLERLNDEDRTVAEAVRRVLPSIARAVDLAVERWQRGGKIVLFGAGTSGRLAMLDAAELPPTFNAPPERYLGRLAGGPTAFQRAVEGLEDDRAAGEAAAADLGPNDLALGIAASGRTPWVIGALAEARVRGAATVALACVARPALGEVADVVIAVETGPEAVVGSTRMKAGTAQKLVLNSFSTALMVRLGKVYGNLMVDLRPTNAKLRHRAARLVETVAGVDPTAAERAIAETGDLKAAIVVASRNVSPEEARARLARANGILRRALEET